MYASKVAGEEAFRHDARTWLSENVPAPNSDLTPQGRRRYALDWQRRQFEGGWAGISWPVEYGGRGLSRHEQIIWYEEYVRAGAPSVLSDSFVAQYHAGPTLISLGTAEQRAFHLPKILKGETLWCQGFSEPGAGSDLANLQARGQVRSDELIVSGQKLWSSYADIADYQELLIRTDPDSSRHKGLTWIICDMRSVGITVRPIKNIAGSTSFAAVFYDEVRIPLNQVVGTVNDGWRAAMATLGFERGTASVALQVELQKSVELLLRQYVDTHSDATGHSSLFGIEEILTRLWSRTVALRSLTYEVMSGNPDDPIGRFENSMIRLQYAELLQEVQRLGFELSGTEGLSLIPGDLGFTHGYLYGMHDTIAGGTSEIQRNIIAERLLALPRER